MFDFRTTFDATAARDVGNRLGLLKRLVAQSVNSTAAFAEDTSVNRIVDRLNLRRNYVEDKFSIRRASPGRLSAVVTAVDRPVQLRQYMPRQEFNGSRRAGVSVQVLRAGARKTISGAFFGRLKNGSSAVMARKGPNRTPLRVLYSPSPGQMFKTIGPEIEEQSMARLLNDAFERTGGMFDTGGASVRFSK